MTDGFIFYGSFMKALATLPDADRLKAYDAICRYALYDEEPKCDGAALGMFYMAQAQIDANRRKRENGQKGGRPKANKNRQKTEEKQSDNQEETKEKPNDNQEESKTEPKEKDKDKDKVKEKYIKETRHKHGEYKHVLLTDEQYNGLLERFGADKLNAAIKRVDEYCEETGKTYKNYALVIQRWGVPTSTPRQNSSGKFANFPQRNDSTNSDNIRQLIAMQRA